MPLTVADCYDFAGVRLPFDPAHELPAPIDTTKVEVPPNLVSPAMLYDLAAREGWT